MGNDAGKRQSSGSSCKIRLRPDRDSIDNAVMAATALHAAMPAAEAPTGMDVTLSPVAGDVGARAHQMSRAQDLAVTTSPRRNGVIR